MYYKKGLTYEWITVNWPLTYEVYIRRLKIQILTLRGNVIYYVWSVQFNMFSLSLFLSLQLKVTQKQLILFHKAFAAYFSGNHTVMEALTQELQSKLEETRRRGPPAWLEELPSSQEQQ